MYTTVEADIENGRIKNVDGSVPSSAHVLITLLGPVQPSSKRKPDWEKIKKHLGKLKLRQDSVEWQRKIRADW